jgi:hypothetical protein
MVKRFWLGAAGVVLFMLTVTVATALWPRQSTQPRAAGLDFLAFYAAGAAVSEGRAQQLYDLNATSRFQQALAGQEHIPLGARVAPWWNPPFYSLLFVPLSWLPFHWALAVWWLISLICAATACVFLCRLFPPDTSWETRALVPVLLAISSPFVATLTHGQNSCMSLLLLTVTVLQWRKGRPLIAGLAGGLLFYKPQLAIVIAVMMVLDLGWRAALGYAITGLPLFTLNLLILPGTLLSFLHQLPLNLHLIQSQPGYPWERHVTFAAFWRLLLDQPAQPLSMLCVCTLGIALAATILNLRIRARLGPLTRDRLIAATILATPLLMPFYFDYDLLLLAIPAVLLANEIARGSQMDAVLVATWSILYVWLMVNPDVAEHFHINLAVPLLAMLTALLLRRAASSAPAGYEVSGLMPIPHSTGPRSPENNNCRTPAY